MCHFITLVAPTEDVAALRAVMDSHGRDADPIDNPSIRKILARGEFQYLTTRGHCDCGTVLAPRHDTPEAFEKKLAKEITRMKRKGWSDAKIARAVEDRRKADAKPSGGGADGLELWSAVLSDLKSKLKLSHAGLFVRFYSGDIATEQFTASRRKASKNSEWLDALSSLVHDEVTVFEFE